MSSFWTGRRLSAAVISTLLMATLAGCGGGGGGNNTAPPTTPPTGNPNPNPNPPAPQPLSQLTLTGIVTDAPIANAVVTATVGTETFTANADANGAYSLQIEIDPGSTSEFVTLSARGVGPQSYVEFTSLAGTFAALQAQAGDDDILSNTENFATQITNVSTAQALLILEASNGRSIATDADLRALSATLNSQEVLDLATAIKLFVDDSDNYPMPAGQTSLLALMSDAATREQFVNSAYDQNPTVFASTQTAIVTDTSLTQPISSNSVPAKLTAAMLSNAAEFSFNYFNRVNAYTFNADGTGTAAAGSWNVNTTWAINGSTIDITYGETVRVEGYETVANCPAISGQVRTEYASDGAKLTLLSNRVVTITETNRITNLIQTPPPGCQLSARTETTTVARTILGDDDFEQLDAAELADSTQSIYVYDESSGATADIADLHADGSGVTWAFGKQFTWSLDSTGRVVTATFRDGTIAKFRSLRQVDAVTTDLFYEIQTANGRRLDAGASVFADPELPLVFTPENMVGRFYQFGVGVEGSTERRLKGFRLRFDNGGTGSHEDDRIVNDAVVTLSGSNAPDFNFYWDIDGEDVIVRRTRTLNTELVNCTPGSSVECVVYDERRLVPLASITQPDEKLRVYWMEYRRLDWEDGISDNTPPQTVVRFYDYEPTSAPVVLNGKPSPVNEGSARKLRFHGASLR
ncbi:carboxypeptidase-like regulatory domain-containing protein [Steroidobacter cummioxidans]|uniref:carboxypeptidase-like regulatory domain-containing protein n=1 Tax=Steroidobacter cummioxidans TaxID=1803913 RepID=UPI00128FD57E|nr:carboxypeptidase-like regulatory domain-containing protein [Steroidobacter cummioxidans]